MRITAQKLYPLYETNHAHQVALWLLEKLTHKKSSFFLINQKIELTEAQSKQLDQWIEKLVQNKYPLQYLLGTTQFGPLEVLVEPPTLIPRPETEEWVAQLIKNLQPFKNEKLTILDMCTGSGCIAFWLAHEFPHFTIHAADLCQKALQLANKNKEKLGIKNVIFFEGDFFAAIKKDQKYDLIVCNPPYISDAEYQNLEPVVKQWEDKKALVGQQNGLFFYQKLAEQAAQFLKQTGPLNSKIAQLVLEIGADQQKEVEQLLTKAGWHTINTKQDSVGKARTVTAYLT